MHRRWIAETVGIPEHQLRVVAPDIGGGFGAKMHLYPEELLCPYLARFLGAPVKWWESRSESHQSTSHGRAHTETMEVAFRNDGKILGLKVETLGNVGAYLSNMASGGPDREHDQLRNRHLQDRQLRGAFPRGRDQHRAG